MHDGTSSIRTNVTSITTPSTCPIVSSLTRKTLEEASASSATTRSNAELVITGPLRWIPSATACSSGRPASCSSVIRERSRIE